MTTTPDSQTVRKIAREHIRPGRADIGLTLIDHFGNGVLGDEEYDARERAVRPVWRTELRAVSWPDEQPQDERDAEISRLRKLLGIGVDREQWDAIAYAEGARFEHEQTDDNLVGYLAYRYEDMQAQRHILLREIEEAKAHDERDGDVRAVAALAVAADGKPLDYAISKLIARFADRIDALEAVGAKAADSDG